VQSQNPYAALSLARLKAECAKAGLKVSGNKTGLVTSLLAQPSVRYASYSPEDLVDICNTRNIPTGTASASASASASGPLSRDELVTLLDTDEEYAKEQVLEEMKRATLVMPKKKFKFKIKSIQCTPYEFTAGGTPQVDTATLKRLAGSNLFGEDKDAVWGDLYGHYGGGSAGMEACRAVGALAQMSHIKTTIQTFLIPLQELADKDSRIHCSLNLNTETGRLSSRTPNLQVGTSLSVSLCFMRKRLVYGLWFLNLTEPN
jgi:hypothetical protein